MIAIPAGFSPQDYLALEQAQPIRHEYRHGLVYAMAGGSDDHSRIAINLLTEINLQLRDTACQFFSGDVKVSYQESFYYYPDAFVTCDPRDRSNKYVKRYPKLIAEVLSASTAAFDRTDKFEDYQQIPSLEDYVLIAQSEIKVECFCLENSDNGPVWHSKTYLRGDRIYFRSIGLAVAVEDLYRGTSLLE